MSGCPTAGEAGPRGDAALFSSRTYEVRFGNLPDAVLTLICDGDPPAVLLNFPDILGCEKR
jgi:hypothetical protein